MHIFFLRNEVRCSSDVCAYDADCDRCVWIIEIWVEAPACFTSSVQWQSDRLSVRTQMYHANLWDRGRQVMNNQNPHLETVRALTLVFNTKSPSERRKEYCNWSWKRYVVKWIGLGHSLPSVCEALGSSPLSWEWGEEWNVWPSLTCD